MKKLVHYYGAFKKYKQKVAENRDCANFSGAIEKAYSGDDKLEAERSACKIDVEWVDEIESLLPYVIKAVGEERQFIRNEGSVVPIEKAKRVSKTTVEHLARHSNMIRRLPEKGEDLIPDSLYIVEKLSDYAVYENRFLYLLLINLREFVGSRLKKIVDIGNTYHAELFYRKSVQVAKRKLSFDLKLSDEIKDDPNSDFNIEALQTIDRIRAEQYTIEKLLATPLMKTLARTPLLKPPITKTNVLKMNVNFRNSVALYEFIVNYLKPGFEVETIKNTFSPLPESAAEEFSEIVALTVSSSYAHANKLEDLLSAKDKEREQEEREEATSAAKLRLTELKNKLAAKKASPEEYIVALEDYNTALETDRQNLIMARRDIASLNGIIEKITAEKSATELALSKADERETGYIAEIDNMTEAHAEEIASLYSRHTEEIAEKEALCTEEREKTLSDCEARIRETSKNADDKVVAAESALQNVEDKNRVLSARLKALNKDDFTADDGNLTSEERFNELEKEYAAFVRLFNKQWKKTKKFIRKDLLWKTYSAPTTDDTTSAEVENIANVPDAEAIENINKGKDE